MRTNKLFALENLDENIGGEELEASVEVGEVADVQVDVDAEVAEISDAESAIAEGTEAGDQLEEVGEVMEKALEEGEGLDPIAAEAISLAIKAICGRIGANPAQIGHLTAFENFASPSSRRANTKFALEGVGEFLKNLWERIKAAISGLWKKMEAFWNKHGSSLGRLLKALESAKVRVSALKGAPTFNSVDVPAGLKAIFPVKGNLGVDAVDAYCKAAGAGIDAIEKNFRVLENLSSATAIKDIEAAVVADFKGNGVVIELGSESQPVAGGKYYKWTFKTEEVDTLDNGDKIFKIDVEEDHGDFTEGRSEAQMDLVGKEKLKAIVTNMITGVKAMIKYRDKAEARAKKISKTLSDIGKSIDKLGDTDKDAQKHAQSTMRLFQLIMTKGPMMEAKATSVAVATTKGVLGYVDVCAKNHKA